MRGDDERQSGDDRGAPSVAEEGTMDAARQAANAPADQSEGGKGAPPPPLFDDSITAELATLYDDGRTYAEAELAFQKTRAKLAGRRIGIAVACIVVAIVLLHIAFLALAVGMVIALAPLVTIWGAIAIVVGVLMLAVTLLGLKAKSSGERLAALFASPAEDEAP